MRKAIACGVTRKPKPIPEGVTHIDLTRTCGQRVYGGGVCFLKPGHKGYHCAYVYVCDGCGERRRGRPHQDGPEGLGFCFLCCIETKRDRNNYWCDHE